LSGTNVVTRVTALNWNTNLYQMQLEKQSSLLSLLARNLVSSYFGNFSIKKKYY